MTDENRVAIVTGGSRGLGREIVLELVRRGWCVATCARSESTFMGIDDTKVFQSSGDIADREFAARFFDHVLSHFGTPTLLVNNAAILGVVARPMDVDLEDIESALKPNLIGAMNFCREFIAGSSGVIHGAIVNIGGGGIGGRRIESGALPYVISKAALYYFTEVLASNLAGSRITANVLAPGLLPTQFMEAGRETALAIGALDLISEIDKRRQKSDFSVYQRVVDWITCLADPRFSHVNGRLISAQWDSPSTFLTLDGDIDSFRLRRIDGELFVMKQD